MDTTDTTRVPDASQVANTASAFRSKGVFARLIAMLFIAAMTVAALFATTAPASAAPSNSGYFRLELDSQRQIVAVGKLTPEVLRNLDLNGQAKQGSILACQGWIASKIPGPWFVAQLGGMVAINPVCSSLIGALWKSEHYDRSICFRYPLANWKAAKLSYCS